MSLVSYRAAGRITSARQGRADDLANGPPARYAAGVDEPNPYQSPVSLDEPPQSDVFYTQRLAALRYVELWRTCSNWRSFLGGSLSKALRLPGTIHTAFRPFAPLRVLDERELTASGREKVVPLLESCRQLGLQLAFYCAGERRDSFESFASQCLNQSGTIAAALLWARVCARRTVIERLHCVLQSWLNDDVVLSTSNQRQMLDAPAVFQRMHLPGASIADLLRIHSERLQNVPLGHVRVLDRDRLLERMNADKRLIAEFHVRRGFWVPARAPVV